jgi:hypothetical protein
MVTIFAVPKPFEGHVGRISTQCNPQLETPGLRRPDHPVRERPRDCRGRGGFDVEHLPEIDTNEFGTPLLHSAFRQAQDAASHEIVCYANADLISSFPT